MVDVAMGMHYIAEKGLIHRVKHIVQLPSASAQGLILHARLLQYEYSGTSEQRALWDRSLCPLYRGCPLFGGCQIFALYTSSSMI